MNGRSGVQRIGGKVIAWSLVAAAIYWLTVEFAKWAGWMV